MYLQNTSCTPLCSGADCVAVLWDVSKETASCFDRDSSVSYRCNCDMSVIVRPREAQHRLCLDCLRVQFLASG